MNFRTKVIFVWCIFAFFFNEAVQADKEDKSEESLEDLTEMKFNNDTATNSTSAEEGPPDSHEAMNNREIKMAGGGIREKRSYEFLIGLVNNNSRYEVTNVDHTTETSRQQSDSTQSKPIQATDLLLELLVKISAHPNQWENVHNFLKNLDNDLETSKKILNEVYNLDNNKNSTKQDAKENIISLNKKTHYKQNPSAVQREFNKEYIDLPKPITKHSNIKNKDVSNTGKNMEKISNNTHVQKLIVVLGGNHNLQKENNTEKAVKSNKWPVFDEEASKEENFDSQKDNFQSADNGDVGKYPWQMQQKSIKNPYQHNFAYHRVTGQPYLSNVNKNPKAYIAVSVIAPKPLVSKSQTEDLALENELRQLKPWTHKQNLKADLRDRWTMQTEEYKGNYAP